MVEYIIYDQTGFITRSGSAPDLDQFLDDGETIMEGSIDKPSSYYVSNGVVKPYPAKPSPSAEFDFSREVWFTTDEGEAADLAAAKTKAYADVMSFIDTATIPLTSGVPEQEQKGWGSKETAANAVLAGTAIPSQIRMIEAEAGITGETVEELCESIIRKATAYSNAVGVISGIRRKAEGALAMVTTSEECLAVVQEVISEAMGAMSA